MKTQNLAKTMLTALINAVTLLFVFGVPIFALVSLWYAITHALLPRWALCGLAFALIVNGIYVLVLLVLFFSEISKT